jgi:hypothetical protein
MEDALANLEIEPNMKKEFWYHRHVEARRWVWLMMISNTLFQLRALSNPHSESHFYVNLGYTVYNLVVVILLSLSYRTKESSILILPALIMANMRQIMRFADLEDTKPEITGDEEESNTNGFQTETWRFTVIIQWTAFIISLLV